MTLDGFARKIAGFGVPGLVALVAVSATGYTGAAAVTTALSALGGPLGMVGGIGMFILISYASAAIAQNGTEAIFKAVVDELVQDGTSRKEMMKKIEGYPISESLRLKLKKKIRATF